MSFIALRARKKSLTHAVVGHADVLLVRAAGMEVRLERLQLEVWLRCKWIEKMEFVNDLLENAHTHTHTQTYLHEWHKRETIEDDSSVYI